MVQCYVQESLKKQTCGSNASGSSEQSKLCSPEFPTLAGINISNNNLNFKRPNEKKVMKGKIGNLKLSVHVIKEEDLLLSNNILGQGD